jgi:hypothetical protein
MKKYLQPNLLFFSVSCLCLVSNSSNCQSYWSTQPHVIKIVGGSLLASAIAPFVAFGNTATTGINFLKLSGSKIENLEVFQRLYAGMALAF